MRKKVIKRKDLEIQYICLECADKNGGENCDVGSTWHFNTCDYCGKPSGVASVADWDWPRGLPKGFSLIAGRD